MSIGTIFDWIVLVVVLLSAGVAFFRGFIREVLTILGVVGGLVAALFLGPHVRPLMRDWLEVQSDPAADPAADSSKLFDLIPYSIVADIAAYGGVFVVVLILLHIVSFFATRLVHSAGLGPVDRTLGVVFGIARAVIVLGLIYMLISFVLDEKSKNEMFADSKTHIYIEGTANMLRQFLPEDHRPDTQGASGREEVKDVLKSMDVLKDDVVKGVADGAAKGAIKSMTDQLAAPQKTNPAKTDPSAPSDAGYDDTARNKLNQLIEQTDTPPTEPPAANE